MSLRQWSSRKLYLIAVVASILPCAMPARAAYADKESSSESATTGSTAVPRIVERVDENRLATLVRNTRPEARAEYDRGPVATNLVMGDLFLVLRRSPERQAAFDAYLAAEYDRKSPNFHQWLSPAQIGERFGPAQTDIDTITQWLQNHGLSVSNLSNDRMTITFAGTAGQIQSTFHTEIHNLDVKGESHIANMSDPRIPEALTPVVVGVKALHNFFPHPQHKLGGQVRRDPETGGWVRISNPAAKPVNPAAGQFSSNRSHSNQPRSEQSHSSKSIPLFGTGGTPATIEDVAPYDFATIYNVLPLWNAATPIDGAGQTIAIAGRSNINLSDVATFRSAFGLPPNVPTVKITNTDPGICQSFAPGSTCEGDLIENTLDVEWSGAVAPKASIILVTSSGTTATSDGSLISEQYIVQNVTAPIMNVSYGECELFMGTAGNTMYSSLWSTAEMAGIAVFVASGDDGSATCEASVNYQVPYGAQYGLSVSGIASTPYNTAVGGTDFAWGWITNGQTTYWGTSNADNQSNALGYIPENPWNSTCSNSSFVSLVDGELSENLTAGELCDQIGLGEITSGGQPAYYLVSITGGGGGSSNCITGDGSNTTSCTAGYPKPAFQSALTPPDNSRDVPDISFFAANGFSGTAYLICVTAAGSSCGYTQATEPVQPLEVGGTSVASPIMAAVMALINQKAGSPQGNPNTELYKLAAAQNYGNCSSEAIPLSGSSCVFNDIDQGTNAMPCTLGYPDCSGDSSQQEFGVLSGFSATTGYDLTTGLGSANVANLVNAFAPSSTSAPAVTLSEKSLTFATTAVGSTAATQKVTLKNTGNATLDVTGISISGTNASSFSEVNTCGKTVAAGSSCVIAATFKPTAAGKLSASVKIADNADGSPQSVGLSGTSFTSTPIVSLSVKSLAFATTDTNSTVPTKEVTLKNTGTGALALTSVSITGTNPSEFTETNNCGKSVAASGSCTITVGFKPAASGTFAADVSFADNASGSPQKVTLTGTAVAPVVELSHTALTFASTEVGSAAAIQKLTLKNAGKGILYFKDISITGANATSFTQTNTCGTSLAAAASCIVAVAFKPKSTGALKAAVTFADNAPGAPESVNLTGTAVAPIAKLSATELNFDNTFVGESSAAQKVTLKNSGSAALDLSSIAFTGKDASSFAETKTCGASLAVGASCIVGVTFKPAAVGALSASLSFTDNGTNSPQTVTLKGTGVQGVPAVTLSTTSLPFPNTDVGSPSASLPVTVKNTGTGPLSITTVTITGTYAAAFSETKTCTASLAAGASCTINVSFKPTAGGALKATLGITDTATGSPQQVALTGTGVRPAIALSHTHLTYTGTQVGTAAATQSITLKDTGTGPLLVSGITITGTDSSSYSQTSTCGSSVAVGATCVITVTFKPAASGALTATLQIADNVIGAPQLIDLSGTGD